MGNAVVRAGTDTWIGSGKPNQRHYGTRDIRVSNTHTGFVYAKSPVPRGATVASAVLRIRVRDAWTVSRTINLRRVTTGYKMGRLTWNHRPSVGAIVASRSGTADGGDWLEFDVTDAYQGFANGAANYGFEISTDAAAMKRLAGFKSSSDNWSPSLTVEWSDAPDKPTNLIPGDGGVVSVTHPTLQFDYTDVSGSTQLGSVNVQVLSPWFDSGEVVTTAPELDLADTAFLGLADDTQWRVRVKDEAGLWSEWSDWTDISVVAKGTTTILAPTDGGTVTDVTPPVLWSFSGTQTAYRVMVAEGSAPSRLIHDSGRIKGTDTAYGIPKRVLVDDVAYLVRVDVYDDQSGRVATPGDPIYARASAEFTLDDDAATPGIADLTASAANNPPRVTLSWSRTEVPDSWTIRRDGKVIASGVEPLDTLTSGTAHEWSDVTVTPAAAHTYTVQAVVNGKSSTQATVNVAEGEINFVGMYLVNPDTLDYVAIAGDEQGSWESPEEAEVYAVMGSSRSVRVVSAMRGLEGDLTGTLVDGFGGKSLTENVASLNAMKATPSGEPRLVLADLNIPVLVGDVTISPVPTTRKGQASKDVKFSFWQTGELPFTFNL